MLFLCFMWFKGVSIYLQISEKKYLLHRYPLPSTKCNSRSQRDIETKYFTQGTNSLGKFENPPPAASVHAHINHFKSLVKLFTPVILGFKHVF